MTDLIKDWVGENQWEEGMEVRALVGPARCFVVPSTTRWRGGGGGARCSPVRGFRRGM